MSRGFWGRSLDEFKRLSKIGRCQVAILLAVAYAE